MIMNKLKVIDIGHSNLSIDTAMLDLETKISQLNFEGDYKVVKSYFWAWVRSAKTNNKRLD